MNKKYTENIEENQFALSTGDLMAALLLIFVLLLIGTMLKLQEEFDSKSDIAERYKELQIDLYDDLYAHFKDSLLLWNAEIDSSLTIRFKFVEPYVLFKPDKYEMEEKFEGILTSFFPQYIAVIRNEKYIDHIEEIRIEGHTSIEGKRGQTDEEAYFYNMELSQNRSRTVLKYCLNLLDNEVSEWTKKRSTANGLSSVKPIADNTSETGRQQNRRVEFRVRTDSEAQIREMLRYATNK